MTANDFMEPPWQSTEDRSEFARLYNPPDPVEPLQEEIKPVEDEAQIDVEEAEASIDAEERTDVIDDMLYPAKRIRLGRSTRNTI